MSISFDFPINPTIGDIVVLPDGSEAEWNGYAWVASGGGGDVTYPITIDKGGTNAITALEALTNLGITTSTGEFIIPDGTVTSPGLAFTNELGLGFYRATDSVIHVAAQGTSVLELNTADPLSSSLGILPRTLGASSFNMYGNVSGTADMALLGIGINGVGANAYISSVAIGAGTPVPIYYNAPSHHFTGPVTADNVTLNGPVNTNNCFIATGDVNNNAFYSPVGNILVGGTISGYSASFAAGATGITAAQVGLGAVLNERQVGSIESGQVRLGWNGANMTCQVDATYFGATWPMSISGNSVYANNAGNANTVAGMPFAWSDPGSHPAYVWGGNDPGSQWVCPPGRLNVNYANTAGDANTVRGCYPDTCSAFGYASANYSLPYLRFSGGDIRYLIWGTSNDTTVMGLRLYPSGINYTFEITGSGGAFGIGAAPSDERLKKNILPTVVNASATITQIQMIEHDWKDPENTTHVPLSFSAQNLQSIDPLLVFSVKQPDDSPQTLLSGSTEILNPNTQAIIAYLTKALQETIARLDLLENK